MMKERFYILIVLFFSSIIIFFSSGCETTPVREAALPGKAVVVKPRKEPILRLETGMHTARIIISIDTKGHYLATASRDKTARIWDLNMGRLLNTFRPPIGDGHEGELYSVAISPDGETVACSGWTKFSEEDTHSIYLFDRLSGRLLHRINSTQQKSIGELAYFNDGRRLAAASNFSNEIEIYSVPGYSLIEKHTVCGNDIKELDFDQGGRLVTVCNDGTIRLYDAHFRLIYKKKIPEGKPRSVRFSPDGNRIAIGYGCPIKVVVLLGRDLSQLYSPDTKGVGNGNLSRICWSSDGRFLYAGGNYEDGSGISLIRKWSNQGRGGYTKYPACRKPIWDLRPHPGGGLIFTGGYAWGVLDAKGRRTRFQESITADYRDNLRKFLISHEGAVIQFGYKRHGKTPARFSITERLLDTDLILEAELAQPKLYAPGLKITNWKFKSKPKLNGKPLKLKGNEVARCLAIAPDRQSFLFGAC